MLGNGEVKGAVALVADFKSIVIRKTRFICSVVAASNASIVLMRASGLTFGLSIIKRCPTGLLVDSCKRFASMAIFTILSLMALESALPFLILAGVVFLPFVPLFRAKNLHPILFCVILLA